MRGPVMSTLTPQTSRPGGRGARGPQPADGGAQPAEALCHPPVHQQLRPGTEAQRHPDLGGGWAPGRPRPAGRRGEPGPCPCQAWPAGESRTGPASRGPVFPLLSERAPLPRFRVCHLISLDHVPVSSTRPLPDTEDQPLEGRGGVPGLSRGWSMQLAPNMCFVSECMPR